MIRTLCVCVTGVLMMELSRDLDDCCSFRQSERKKNRKNGHQIDSSAIVATVTGMPV